MSTTDNTQLDHSTSTVSPPGEKGPRKPRRKPLARSYQPPGVAAFLSTKEAADALRTTVEALRARLRRAAVADKDGNVTAPLAPGVVGVRFGSNTWRVRFDAK